MPTGEIGGKTAGTGGRSERKLTPADGYVPPEVFLLEGEGESQQCLQVHPLHQQPEVISQDAKLEEGHGRLTGGLPGQKSRGVSDQ